MIRRIHVRGWRAFDDLTLELGEGLTFVVAENGVGKTSLVQAAAWGLYGPLSTVDARSARRVGADATRVEVDLDLPDGRTLAIARDVRDRGEAMHASLGGRTLDDDGVAAALAEAYGASREFLSMTTMLPSDVVATDATGAFELQTHLRQVFGVDNLQAAADALGQLHVRAEEAARQVRQASRRADADRTRLRTELAEGERAEAAAAKARTDARRVLAFAETQLRAARERAAAVAKAATAREQLVELVAQARRSLGRGARLGRIARPAELLTHLEAAEVAAVERLDGHRREAATVSGRLVAVGAAATSLHAADAECPVCRRDLSAADVDRAARGHDEELADLATAQESLATQVEAAERRLAELRSLTRRVARLPEVNPPDDGGDIDVDGAAFAVQAAREEAERLDEEAILARTHAAALAELVKEADQVAREAEQAARAHRREAVTAVAAEVMRATADAILTERIDPLVAEVGHRWKRVFGERGSLRLRADGHLVLVRGVHEIPFAQFSSGEKVVALLATRLLVLGASTRASFLWLDEPLEHLDPRNRRITASLMTAAGGHVRQILVTTYEEALARRLTAAASAQLRYVRTAEG